MSQVSIDCIRYSEGTTNITQYMTTGTFVYVILSCLQNFKQNECSVKCMDLTNLRPILENKLFQKWIKYLRPLMKVVYHAKILAKFQFGWFGLCLKCSIYDVIIQFLWFLFSVNKSACHTSHRTSFVNSARDWCCSLTSFFLKFQSLNAVIETWQVANYYKIMKKSRKFSLPKVDRKFEQKSFQKKIRQIAASIPDWIDAASTIPCCHILGTVCDTFRILRLYRGLSSVHTLSSLVKYLSGILTFFSKSYASNQLHIV